MPNGIWTAGVDLPEGKYQGTAHLYQNKIYYVSGDNFYEEHGNTLIYDLEKQSWASQPGDPKTNRKSVLINGKLYFVTGADEAGQRTSEVDIYNIETGQWTKGEPAPLYILQCSCIAYGTKIYCIGGQTNALSGGGRIEYADTLYIYDTATNKWSTGANMKMGRKECQCALYGSKIYLFGGQEEGGTVEDDQIQIYDIPSNTWSLGGIRPGKPYYHTNAVIGTKVHLFTHIAHDVYDFSTNTWASATPHPTPRQYSSAVTVGDKIYLLGGTHSPVTVEIYTPDGEVDPPIDPPIDPPDENNCCCNCNNTSSEFQVDACLTFKFKVDCTDVKLKNCTSTCTEVTCNSLTTKETEE